MLTYGIDFFRDVSENTDSSVSTVFGFGPPSSTVSSTPNVPNASLYNLGVFAQGDLELHRQFSVILGVRYTNVHAETRTTPGVTAPVLSQTDGTLAGAANAIFAVNDNLNLVATVGRGFRSPNLVERFFNGPTPEGSGFQVSNTTLKPETSLNTDLGLRYRNNTVYVEAFVFRNKIRNGISIASTGDTIMGLPAFQNVNVDELRFTGVEIYGDVRLPLGFSMGAHFTHLDSKDVTSNVENPVGESFSTKVGGNIRYTYPTALFWVEYAVRHNGKRKDAVAGGNPIGTTLPAFTVHSARAGMTILRRGNHVQRIGIAVTNITNALYAEFSNAAFFRPEARRGVTLTWEVSF